MLTRRAALLLAPLLALLLAVPLALSAAGLAALSAAGFAAACFLVAATVAAVAHEAGHAAVARACGIGVERLGLGLGPRLAGRRVRGVELALHALPVGAYAAVRGFADPDLAGGFRRAPRRARVAVLLAGPGANLLVAALCLVGAPLAAGAAPAEALAVAGQIASLFVASSAQAVAAPLGGSLLDLPVAGPVGTAAVLARFAAGGPPMALVALAGFSTAVGIANLLPLPLLDGGELLAVLRGRPLAAPAARARAARRAWVLLGLLIAAATILDLARIAVGHPYAA